MIFRVLACLLVAGPGGLSVATAATLQHDLFARPALESLKPVQSEPVKTVKPVPPSEWKPELRAIITGGGSTIVNVEGRIVQIGQEIDGYRLIEVKDRRATFVKDKVRYTLDLSEVKGAGAPAAALSAPAVAPAPPAAAPSAPAAPTAPPAPSAQSGPSGMGSVKAFDVLSKSGSSVPEARAADDDRKSPARRGG
jgi:hypothetical protein